MMVERQKDGRYQVFVSVHKAGQMQHTIPCQRLRCPVCSRVRGTVDREFAQEIEAEFYSTLRDKRKASSQRSLKSRQVQNIGQALQEYKTKRGNIPVKQQSTFNRLYDELGRIPVESSWTAADGLVARYRDEFRPASVNRHVTMLKAAIRLCYETRLDGGVRLIPDNYLSSYKLLDEKNIEYLILSGEQMRRFWDALDHRLKPFFYFGARVPIREGEAFNLTREHVDPFKRIIRLPYEYTKQGEPRTIPILEELMPYTMEFWSSPATHYFNRGEREGYAPLGYLSEESGKIEFTLRTPWEAAAKAAGAPRFNKHKLRQQAVMGLWADGWTEEEIRIYGGWSLGRSDRDAFYHYFDRETALHIRKGQRKLDLSWHKTFAEELRRAA
jgi:integrase